MEGNTDNDGERFRKIKEARDREDDQYLIRALLDPDFRTSAAKYLGEMGAVSAVPALLRLLDAADSSTRVAAAQTLGRLGSQEALSRLQEVALHDPAPGVRAWATAAIGDIGDTGSVDVLLPLLRDPSVRVRGATALALGRLGDARALESLRTARKVLRRSPLEWYWHRGVYNQAIKALGRDPASGAEG